MSPFDEKPVQHFTVRCDECALEREVCGDQPTRGVIVDDGRSLAVRRFLRAGWVCHVEPDKHRRKDDYERAEREGRGRWRCPACARLHNDRPLPKWRR